MRRNAERWENQQELRCAERKIHAYPPSQSNGGDLIKGEHMTTNKAHVHEALSTLCAHRHAFDIFFRLLYLCVKAR